MDFLKFTLFVGRHFGGDEGIVLQKITCDTVGAHLVRPLLIQRYIITNFPQIPNYTCATNKKPPLCKGRWQNLDFDGGIVKIWNNPPPAYAGAPFTQRGLV